MGFGSILAGAGRIGREYEQDVSRGMADASRLLANQGVMRTLSEQDRMEQMRQGMASAPRFDYGAATAAPQVTVTQGSLPAASAAPAASTAPAASAQRTTSPASPATAAPAASTVPAVDPWVAKNRAEEADRAERTALASRFGPFGGLVKWFRGIRAEEEAKRQAYIAEATGQPDTAPRGLGTRLVTGQIPGAARPVPSRTAAPAPQTTPVPQAAPAPQATAPVQQAAPAAQPASGYTPTSYAVSPQAAQQVRMLDMQAKQLMHVLDSWQRAGAPQGGYEMAMQAQGKLMELALARVNMEMQNAVSMFERGGDPTAMVALLNQITGQPLTVYQHPQNPQMVALGPPNARPEALSWTTPAQLASSVRMMSDQQFRNQVWQLQSKIAEKQAEQQGQMAVEGVKGQYKMADTIAGKQADALYGPPKTQTYNRRDGSQGTLTYDARTGQWYDIGLTGPREIAGETLPPVTQAVPVRGMPGAAQPQPQPQPQQVQQSPTGHTIIPGYLPQ